MPALPAAAARGDYTVEEDDREENLDRVLFSDSFKHYRIVWCERL